MERANRKVLKGTVISDKMDKTVVVKVETLKQHPRYKKYYTTGKKFYVRDENEQCNVGDFVEIVETRPLSKTVHWRISRIVKRTVGE